MLLRISIISYFLFVSSSIASPPSIEEVKRGIEEHYAKYNDYEFVYDVKSKTPKGEYEKLHNTYRLHMPEEGHPWQYLVKKKNSPLDNISEIDNFSAFNGKETRVFERVALRKGDWSKCVKVAGYSWDSFINDPYSQFLVQSIVGLPFTTMDDHAYDKFWEQKKDAHQFAGKRTLDGHDVFIFKSDNGKNKEYELHVLGPPHFMIVRVKATNIDNGKVLQLIDVEKIGSDKGIIFPKKGHCFRASHKSNSAEITGIDYSYDVTEVRHLDKVDPATWFPEIPPGTVVVDHIVGENITLPWSDRQKKLLAKQREDLVPSLASPISSTFRKVCFAVGLLLIFLIVFLHLKKVRKSK